MKSEVRGGMAGEFEEDGVGLEGTGEEVDDKEAEGKQLTERPLSLYLKAQKEHSLSLTALSASGGQADGRKRQRKGIREKKKKIRVQDILGNQRGPKYPHKPWESR